MYSHKAFNDFWWKFLFSLKEFLIALSVIGSNQYYINFLCWGSQGIHTIQPLSLRSDYVTPALTLVFCCIVAWIQPDISGCQQDFLVVWKCNVVCKSRLRQFSQFLWQCIAMRRKNRSNDSFSSFGKDF